MAGIESHLARSISHHDGGDGRVSHHGPWYLADQAYPNYGLTGGAHREKAAHARARERALGNNTVVTPTFLIRK